MARTLVYVVESRNEKAERHLVCLTHIFVSLHVFVSEYKSVSIAWRGFQFW